MHLHATSHAQACSWHPVLRRQPRHPAVLRCCRSCSADVDVPTPLLLLLRQLLLLLLLLLRTCSANAFASSTFSRAWLVPGTMGT
jgi:hypothetical protein